MIPIPAIDLKDGKVVRLLHGNFKEEKIYFDGPESIAARFREGGATRIHVVDLDGALKGKPANLDSIERIIKESRVPIEVGGGIRNLEIAETYFEMGVSWVILGTKACLDQGFLKEALSEFGERIILGLDALNGLIATDGWTRVTKISAVELAKQAEKLGAKTIIYTDISKDGALKGPNLPEVAAIADAVSVNVIASGGIGSLADLKALTQLKRKNISGVIIGKALYENKFTLPEAIKTCLPNA